MKNLLLFLLLASSAQATWTLKQTHNNTGCASGSATCNISMTATAGGAVLIVTAYAPTASITISSVSGTESWVNPSCGNTQGAFSIDTQYALLSAPGITSYTVTLSSAPTGGWTVFMAEVATDKIAAFDVCANRLQSSTSTSIAGEIVALGGANDYIAQSIYREQLHD
jgi:hypothetical protein